jgi:predicted transcriptional regulator
VALVSENPGITIPEIAEKMGIRQNYLYRVLPSLAEEGLVFREGRGWWPKTPQT